MSVALSKRPVPRRQRFTILLVGEGHAEVALLTHLKGLYASRGSGVAVSIRNARGKGAAYVVNYAIRQTRNAAYDRVVTLLDADTDWNSAVRSKAARAHIEVIACAPCLEVLLLHVRDEAVRDGLTSVQIKQQFKARFGAPAHEPHIYPEHFGRQYLDHARHRLGELDRLLRAFAALSA